MLRNSKVGQLDEECIRLSSNSHSTHNYRMPSNITNLQECQSWQVI